MGKKRTILDRIKPLSAWDDEEDPLKDYSFNWMDVRKTDAAKLRKCVDIATREEDVQAFLQERPIPLVQHLGGGHGRYVMSKVRLGSQHIPDFILAERDSDGLTWHLVELESPHARMFTKAGDPSSVLTHAIRQINDWREWIGTNRDYASRPRSASGLGLEEITTNAKGLILIGRRADNDDANIPLRRRLAHDNRIELHSFDYLIDKCAWAADASKALRGQFKESAKKDSKKKK